MASLGAVLTGAYALAWLVALVVVALRLRGRAGPWLVAAAAFLAANEDAALSAWLALAPPTVDPHGVAGLVPPHAQGHFLGAGAWALVAAGLCVVLALGPLRRGERWAWWALLGAFLVGATADVAMLLAFYGHGLGGEGFGWPVLALYLAAWPAGLWLSAARPRRGPP